MIQGPGLSVHPVYFDIAFLKSIVSRMNSQVYSIEALVDVALTVTCVKRISERKATEIKVPTVPSGELLL